MCGIVALLSKYKTTLYKTDEALFRQMLYAGALRGWDATGVFGVTEHGNATIVKQATPAGWFLGTKEYTEFAERVSKDFRMVVGHNRKATHGDRKDEDAHPFMSGDIILVHNGMINNHKLLDTKATVDSHAVAKAFHKDGYLETLKKIDGAYAFIWYNIKEKSLNFIRNDKRPLTLIETSSKFLLCSEGKMGEWLLSRNNLTIDKVIDLVPETLYTINLDEPNKLIEEKLDLKKSRPLQATGKVHYLGVGTHYSRRGVTGSVASVPPYINNGTEIDDDKLFYTTETLTKDNMKEVFAHGKLVNFMISNYEKIAGNLDSVRVTGTPLNVKSKDIEVACWVKSKDLDDLLYNGVAAGVVGNCFYNEGKWTIYTTQVEELDIKVTSNGMYISEQMWFSDIFPTNCNVCNRKVIWKELEDCDVEIHGPNHVEACCPSCTKEINNAVNAMEVVNG